jgi:murein DD-endopeptidase MepM/ murein hydrolase activator NlpD
MWIGVCYLLGTIGFLGYLPGASRELRLLVLLFVVPLVVNIMRAFHRQDTAQSPAQHTVPLPPVSGGMLPFALRAYGSLLVTLFIPTMWLPLVRQTIGNTVAAFRAVQQAEEYAQKVRYSLPFAIPPDGTNWYVYNGGVTAATSHSWDIVAQRYAYDFVVVDNQGKRWRTDGGSKDDYLCYGLPVLAPADGEVVAVVDGVRDAPAVGTGWIDLLTLNFPGCTITIRHAEHEYSFLAHLKPGSLLVKVGDHIKRGQTLAHCGHSGHSTEPHLHFQVQDRADFFMSAGLPIRFEVSKVNEMTPIPSTYLTRGERVCFTDDIIEKQTALIAEVC